MQRNQITNLSNCPLAGDAVSYDLLLEHSVRSLSRVKEGTIRLNRQNVAIVIMANDCFASLVLLVESNLLYAQQPFAVRRGLDADALTIIYLTSNRTANNSNYRF